MRLLVFQHLHCEHPGSFRRLLARDGITCDTIALDQGDPIPDLATYDSLWVMGGPMDVWDVDTHPWLVAEKAAIRTWVRDLGKPYLGLCLGHQLLADALGGTCGPQNPPEIGIYDITLTDAGRRDPLMAGFPTHQRCLQWHSVRVAQPPEGAQVLASSPACPVQAMRVGARAWSLQYHVEIEPDTVDNWAAIPAYHAGLVASLGETGVTALRAAAAAEMDGFLDAAERIYDNFMGAIGRDGVP